MSTILQKKPKNDTIAMLAGAGVIIAQLVGQRRYQTVFRFQIVLLGFA